MQGTGSDTRMYSPRSESSHMYSSVNEDDEKYNPVDPQFKEEQKDRKQVREDKKENTRNELKHIKVRRQHGVEGGATPNMTEPGLDDTRPREDEQAELSRTTGMHGSRGQLLDMATGAKTGTGSAMGHAIAMSDPMDGAMRLLEDRLLRTHIDDLIAERDKLQESGLMNEAREFDKVIQQSQQPDIMRNKLLNTTAIPSQFLLDPDIHPEDAQKLGETMMEEGRQSPDYIDMRSNPKEYDPEMRRQYMGNVSRLHTAMPKIQQAENLSQEMQSKLQEDDPSKFFADRPYVQTGIPMNEAWSDLLKDEPRPHAELTNNELDGVLDIAGEIDSYPEGEHPIFGDAVIENPNLIDELAREAEIREQENTPVEGTDDSHFTQTFQDIYTGIPMGDAWSDLLKLDTPKTIAERRKKEGRTHFRPSTGQFKMPPGGQSGGVGATMRRFKARMRGIKSGKKTGLMRSPLAVEMSHRGIKTKQPKSKQPIEYRPYMGQQETRKIMGGVRTTWSPHARYGERFSSAGKTGGGRLTGLLPGQQGQMNQPSLKRISTPRIPKPKMPRSPPMMPQAGMPEMGSMSSIPSLPSLSSPIMASEDKPQYSDIVKMNYTDLLEIRTLLRRIANAKESKKKMAVGTKSATEGAMPIHPAGIDGTDDEDTKTDGPTQNLERNSSRMGLDPAGYLIGRGGHMG